MIQGFPTLTLPMIWEVIKKKIKKKSLVLVFLLLSRKRQYLEAGLLSDRNITMVVSSSDRGGDSKFK